MKKKILNICWLMLLVLTAALTQAPVAAQSNVALPAPPPCPTGFKWSLTGGLAHCVAEDPICVGGKILEHDALGNPSCVPPPTCGNGATNYPMCNAFPTCGNGATNYPMCNAFPTCGNGATNYPECNKFPTCSNGAINYPQCDSFASVAAPDMAVPSLTEVGISATLQLETYGDGTWRIARLNCGTDPYANMAQACKTTYVRGNFFPQGRPSAYEINRTNYTRRLGTDGGAVNDPDCTQWRSIDAQSVTCYQITARTEIDPRNFDGAYVDDTHQFTLNIRSKSNPAQMWSVKVTFRASSNF